MAGAETQERAYALLSSCPQGSFVAEQLVQLLMDNEIYSSVDATLSLPDAKPTTLHDPTRSVDQ